MSRRNAPSAPNISGAGGPWPPPWPDDVVPGCGGRGDGGGRCGIGPAVGFGVTRDPRALPLPERLAALVAGDAGWVRMT